VHEQTSLNSIQTKIMNDVVGNSSANSGVPLGIDSRLHRLAPEARTLHEGPRLRAYRDLRLEDVPTPTIQANEVLVRVRTCGICGSDVHGMDGNTGRRIPPIIMGHEAAGSCRGWGAGVALETG